MSANYAMFATLVNQTTVTKVSDDEYKDIIVQTWENDPEIGPVTVTHKGWYKTTKADHAPFEVAVAATFGAISAQITMYQGPITVEWSSPDYKRWEYRGVVVKISCAHIGVIFRGEFSPQ